MHGNTLFLIINIAMQHSYTSDQREFLWYKCDVSEPQLSRCVITSQWNVVQLPIGMHIMMLELPLVCCNDIRKPLQTSCITTLYIDTLNLRLWASFIRHYLVFTVE